MFHWGDSLKACVRRLVTRKQFYIFHKRREKWTYLNKAEVNTKARPCETFLHGITEKKGKSFFPFLAKMSRKNILLLTTSFYHFLGNLLWCFHISTCFSFSLKWISPASLLLHSVQHSSCYLVKLIAFYKNYKVWTNRQACCRKSRLFTIVTNKRYFDLSIQSAFKFKWI